LNNEPSHNPNLVTQRLLGHEFLSKVLMFVPDGERSDFFPVPSRIRRDGLVEDELNFERAESSVLGLDHEVKMKLAYVGI
jgi:hypothetical protein